MRQVFAVFAFIAIVALAPSARAEPTISTADPAAYASTIAIQMQTQGMDPLRSTFAQITPGAQLSTTIEANLMVFDHAIAHRPARMMRQIEDVTLADTVRHIYYYHYWGDDCWLFTRFEFVRVADDRWALAGLTFGSSWNIVTLGTTPDFRPTTPPH